MDAVGAGGERHVEAPVHQHPHLPAAGGVARRRGDRIDQPEQRGALEPALAHLDPVDAAAHGRRYPRRCRFRMLAAIHHEAQDRASHRAQKLAVPSSGLDAEAYSRRGIRPDS